MKIANRVADVVANRDIDAASELAAAYPDLKSLIDNVPIAEAFRLHNDSAIRWKAAYERFGRIGLFSVLLAMSVFDYQVTLQPRYGGGIWLSSVSASLVALGLASQLFLVFSNAKENWITQRFLAERLRCLKFQAFALLATASSANQLKVEVAKWTKEALAALNQEALGGRAAVTEFSPSEFAISVPSIRSRADPKLLVDAAKVYDSLRLSVQSQHFAEQYRSAEGRARWPAVLSELCFGAGVLLAFLQISIMSLLQFRAIGALHQYTSLQAWLSFLTLLLFIISAIVAVYQRGSGHQPDAERYLAYVREVRRIRMLSAQAHSFVQVVTEMEEVALRELHDFCRDAKQTNYIF